MLSHRFNTIFCHIPKTAGESILRVFVRHHQLDWDDRGELLLRHNADPQRGPERLTHLFAREYVELGYVSQPEFDRYFKFAVVRNPYDRVISEYRYRFPRADCSLEGFLESIPDDPYDDRARHMAPQLEFVSDHNGAIIVDEILRFERLDADISRVFSRIFGRAEPILRSNGSIAPTVDGLSKHAIQLIYRRFEADFDAFRYPSRR